MRKALPIGRRSMQVCVCVCVCVCMCRAWKPVPSRAQTSAPHLAHAWQASGPPRSAAAPALNARRALHSLGTGNERFSPRFPGATRPSASGPCWGARGVAAPTTGNGSRKGREQSSRTQRLARRRIAAWLHIGHQRRLKVSGRTRTTQHPTPISVRGWPTNSTLNTVEVGQDCAPRKQKCAASTHERAEEFFFERAMPQCPHALKHPAPSALRQNTALSLPPAAHT